MGFISGSFIKYLFKHKNRVDSGKKSYKTSLKIPKFLVVVNCIANQYLLFSL